MALFALLIYACKKEHVFENGQATNAAIKFTVSNAKSYLDSTLKTNSTTIKLSGTQGSSKPAAFDGHLFWDKAKAFLNNRFEVVEVPLALDYKETSFYKLGGDTSAYITDKAVAEASFARALIYRDSSNKIIDKRIITYIPDKSYLAKNANPAESNWLNSMDKKFSGYIEYRNWGNEVNMVVRILAGKVVHVYNVSAAPNNDAAGVKTQGLKTNDVTCITYRIPASSTVTTVNGTYYADYTGARYCTICSSPSDDDNFNHNRPPMPPADWQPVYGAVGGGGGSNGGNTTPSYIITVDTSIKHNPKLNCINDKLAVNTVYNDFIKKFKDNSTYNLLIKAEPINSDDLGVTTYDGKLQNGNVTITINTNQVDLAFAIELASTFIHEAFHAFIDQNLIQRHLMGAEVFNQTYAATFDRYVTAQVDSVQKARVALNQPFDPQTVSHEIIAANINKIADGVKEYAEKAWPALKTDPSITFDNYRAIAWGSKGLVGSSSYAKEFDTADKINDLNGKRNATYQSTTHDCN